MDMAIDVKNLDSPALFINRELSWLEFNRRVLEEAEDASHPLLERLKFLAIFSSNLDEFFMIRVAGLKEQLDAGVVNLSADGMSAEEQLAEIRKRLKPMLKRQTRLLTEVVLPALANEGVVIHPYKKLNKSDRKYLEKYFIQNVFPLLTPLAIDSGHPFPQVLNRSLNLVFVISNSDGNSQSEQRYAVVQLPPTLTRFVPIQRPEGYHFVTMDEIIQAHSDLLFPGLDAHESYDFRVVRDADIEVAEDEASDLLREMEEQVRKRRWGAAVRLKIDKRMPEHFVDFLVKLLNLEREDVYGIDGPLNISDFMTLLKVPMRTLKDTPFSTRRLRQFESDGPGVFDAIRNRDLMIHHPFDSFSNNVVKFISAAASDPQTLAIKITLYRAGGDSPVIAALKEAAQNRKHVTALVELKARFDEENNIIWARDLEKAGVHVVYGVLGLKTHCKITSVVRKEEDGIRTYLHLATGNYNQTTARLYTDVAYFTAHPEFGLDAAHLFNFLTGYSGHKDWKRFAVAPTGLSQTILRLIEREIETHSEDNPGEIFVKMNSLADTPVIQALYRASQRGVRVRMIIRGICCLRPGVPGISDNIEVRSIVGRFLEHSRIVYFKNGGEEEAYLSSADWMPRNLYRRVELMFPVPEATAKNRIREILDIYWRDNVKARRLLPEGVYERITPNTGEEEFNAQQYFLDELRDDGQGD